MKGHVFCYKIHFKPITAGRPNASQWNMVRIVYARVGFALGMYISSCLCRFHSRWVPKANPFLGGIWALDSHMSGEGDSPQIGLPLKG